MVRILGGMDFLCRNNYVKLQKAFGIGANNYGTTNITVSDGDYELVYSLEIYDDDGVNRAKITPIE